MSNYAQLNRNWVYVLTCVCMFSLPLKFIAPFAAALLFLVWLIGTDWKQRWLNIRASSGVWLWISLAVLYLAGYFWSADKAEAATSLAVKTSIFVFPVVFASVRFNEPQSKRIMQCFLAGMIAVGAFMLLRAAYLQVFTGHSHWSYQDFTADIMHPSYLALYYVAAIAICFHGILLRDVPRNKKWMAFAMVTFYTALVFMLASKTGLISLLLVFTFYILYAVVRFRRYVVAGIALVVGVVCFFVALQLFPAMEMRIHAMKEVLFSDKPVDPASTESNTVRMLIWKCDRELIAENPMLGVGTGNVQRSLEEKYAEHGMTGALDKKLNAHSQFFQTGIALGLPGLILLAGIFLYGFATAWRNHFGFLGLLTFIITFNFLPESMLQTQAGTLFFGIFYSLVLFSVDKRLLTPDGNQSKT